MIEVEIRGPLSEKDFLRMKELLEAGGGNPRTEKRIFIDYSSGPVETRTLDVRLRLRNDAPEICIKRGKPGNWTEREEIVTGLAPGEFSNAVKTLAALGHTKGMVASRELMHASYAGVEFTLADPGDHDMYYYEAEMIVQNPTEAKEAKQLLEKIAKNLKLPVWTAPDMHSFINKLNERVNYLYDYDTDGPEHFREKFGI